MAKNIKQMEDPFEHFKSYVGKQVFKSSGKPFKSKSAINTVKDVIMHPILHCPAFIFNEDDSYVECDRCSEYHGPTISTSLDLTM